MAKGGKKKPQINPKTQIANNCNATNVTPVFDYSFTATDEYSSKKNGGWTWVFAILFQYSSYLTQHSWHDNKTTAVNLV